MSKELDFSDGVDVIKYQDATSTLHLILSEDGIPFDLTRLDSLTMKIGNDNGYLMEKPLDLSDIDEVEQGNITVKLDGDIMNRLVPDDYRIELWGQLNPIQYMPDTNSMTISVNQGNLDDIQIIFPSENDLIFTVDDNEQQTPSNDVNTYFVDDVINSLKLWKNRMVELLNADISQRLQSEIYTWQGNISKSLKEDLIKSLNDDEGDMRENLSDALSKSFDDLISKEVEDAKQHVSSDLYNQMLSNVQEKISEIKPKITDDLHGSISNELFNELTKWQNDKSGELDNAITKDIVDKSTQIHDNLSNDFVDFITNKLNEFEPQAKSNIQNDVHNQMIEDVQNKINEIKPQITNDVHGELSSELLKEINDWQNNKSNDLDSELAQRIVDKTNEMHNNLSNDFVNFITDKLGDFEAQAKQEITNNLIKQLTDNFTDKFNQTSKEFKNDMDKQVQDVLRQQIDDSLHNMQINGSITVTQKDFDDFKSKIDDDIEKLHLASNLQELIDKAKEDINNINDKFNNLVNNSSVYRGKIDDANNATQFGIYDVSNANNLPNGVTQTCMLNVKNIPKTNYIYQTLMPLWSMNTGGQNELWFRSNGGGNWQSWQKIVSQFDLNKLANTALTEKGELPDGLDLNSDDLINNGGNVIYQLNSKHPINSPNELTNNWGSLILIGNNPQTQIIIADNSWFRVCSSAWKNSWIHIGEKDLEQVNDLNNALYDCFFTDTTANKPDFGRPENGVAFYKSNGVNGVQYAFATGDNNASNGFAWRVHAGSMWGNWHIISSTRQSNGNHDKYPNNLDAFLTYYDGYYTVYYGESSGMPYASNGLIQKVSNNSGGDTFLFYTDIDSSRQFVTTHNWSGWKGWKELKNNDDLNSVRNDLNTAVNQARNDLNGAVNGRVDWGTYNWRTGDLQNQINNRVDWGNYNGRTGDLQNQINQRPFSWDSLSYKGEPTTPNLIDVQQTGIYGLTGHWYGDYPSKAGTVWGHLIVINLAGMVSQFIISNRGRVISRMKSASGVSEWKQLS